MAPWTSGTGSGSGSGSGSPGGAANRARAADRASAKIRVYSSGDGGWVVAIGERFYGFDAPKRAFLFVRNFLELKREQDRAKAANR